MARRTKEITIEAAGRDKGKRFFLTEMSAWDLHQWMAKATLAVTASGNIVPAEILNGGIVGLLAFAIQALTSASFEKAEPLMEQMLRCAQIMPDPVRPQVKRPWVKEDFEEVITFAILQKEVMQLHVNFSIQDEWSKFLSAFRTIAQQSLSNMPTSHEKSGG